MVKITFITFTRNSAARIEGLLKHIRDIVDEIIVVDGFSTDGTVEIAKSYDAKIYLRKPWGYPDPDRMFALRMASNEWIIYLDDDERLCRKLKNDIRDIIEKSKNVSAFSTLRINILPGKKIILGPFLNRQIRIFKKSKVIFKGLVHELPQVHGILKHLPEYYCLLHFIKRDWSRRLFYARLEALQYHKRKTKSIWKKVLWQLAPLSTPLIYLYYLAFSAKNRKPLNIPTLIYAMDSALYRAIVQTIMHIRGKNKTRRAKLIEEIGLIKLLKLDK
ncbi:MAG: glycosyltransferase family 2 protein [archaeon GB-1867-005]|nr:glycosyltransferase family 2 protein [Candidatus Culexmicrobium cathedralense]